ncbi:hypothetical protein Q3G72_003614 [Acer saccharum]|nr:hypothetical protein Q3G72_003614 [Acer saccharum]
MEPMGAPSPLSSQQHCRLSQGSKGIPPRLEYQRHHRTEMQQRERRCRWISPCSSIRDGSETMDSLLIQIGSLTWRSFVVILEEILRVLGSNSAHIRI